MVGGDDDQGVVAGQRDGALDGARQLDRVVKGARGVAGVVAVVDAAALDHQEEALRVCA